MSTSFCTSELTASNRFGYWRDLMCRNFVRADGIADDPDAFDARFTVCPLGDATLFNMDAPTQHWDRSAGHIRKAPSDDYLLTLLVNGHGVLRQSGREVQQTPGVMLLYDTGLPYTYDLRGETVAVKMSRHSLASRVSTAIRPAEALSSDTRLGALTARMLRDAVNLDIEPLGSPALLVGSSLLDIVAAMLDASAQAHEPTDADASSVVLLERLHRYTQAHLGDMSLGVDRLARTHGVSTRTVNRLFAFEGTTPMRWIWQARLQLARTLLDGNPVRRVTDVAFECGFRDAAHFSRSFKARFGMSPASFSVPKRSTQAT